MTTTLVTDEALLRDAPGRVPPRQRPRAAARPEWPRRIGLMNDYLRVPWANGSSYASQFLHRRFTENGHEVTLIGPREGRLDPTELPPRTIPFPAAPLRCSGVANDGSNRIGTWLAFPGRAALAKAAAANFDVVLGQTCNELLDLGIWLRLKHRVPFLTVNTLHFASAYNAMLPNVLLRSQAIHGWFRDELIPWLEGHSAKVHNDGDGLIVLSDGLADYWRKRGVTAPIHVVPRSVDPDIFDRPAGADPFPGEARRGMRLLSVSRHAREKDVDRLIELFARYVLPAAPQATLTLVGDGPEHEELKALAARLGVEQQVFFPGEVALSRVPGWYRHADVFLYASLSETYGQVVSEAAWCGLPVIAFADGMGVESQLAGSETGAVVAPGPDREVAHWRFAREVVSLLRHSRKRELLGRAASARARRRSDPDRVLERYYEVFAEARRHAEETLPHVRHPERKARAAIARWAVVQAAAVGLGALRAPPVVNRRGVRPPSWSDAVPAPPAVD